MEMVIFLLLLKLLKAFKKEWLLKLIKQPKPPLITSRSPDSESTVREWAIDSTDVKFYEKKLELSWAKLRLASLGWHLDKLQ